MWDLPDSQLAGTPFHGTWSLNDYFAAAVNVMLVASGTSPVINGAPICASSEYSASPNLASVQPVNLASTLFLRRYPGDADSADSFGVPRIAHRESAMRRVNLTLPRMTPRIPEIFGSQAPIHRR